MVVQLLSRVLFFAIPWTVAHQLCPWNFPGRNTVVSCCFLLQGVFVTQGSNPSLLHWQEDSLLLSHQGGPDFHCNRVFTKQAACGSDFCLSVRSGYHPSVYWASHFSTFSLSLQIFSFLLIPP